MIRLLKKIFYRGILFFCFLFFTQNSIALEQNGKQWLGINTQNAFGEDHQKLYYIFSQLRFVDQTHPWEAILLEGGLGHRLSDHSDMWLGYRWTGRNPFHDFFQENRLIQQIISRKKMDLYHFSIRSRLEEINRTNNSQIALRLRERVAVEIQHYFFKNARPLFYDELFFELTRTSYQPGQFVGENRLFLGFNFYQTPQTWWEIGYINQFLVKTPQQTQNQMNHILSVTYSF